MFLFGKNIEFNICMLIIFVDSVELFVFVLFVELKLLFGLIFIFNNFVLFVDKKDMEYSILVLMFWEISFGSF